MPRCSYEIIEELSIFTTTMGGERLEIDEWGQTEKPPGGKLKMMKALPPGAHSQSCSQLEGEVE
jgi:hypothetical protein